MLVKRSFSFSFLASGLTLGQRLHFFIATVGGAGDSLKAPGTVGSLVALLLFYPIALQVWWVQLAAVILVSAIGVFSSHRMGQVSGKDDDQRIVIDEVAGMWITLMFFPPTPALFIGGFLLFRVLDIVKVFPANYCDEKIHGGWGVMLDDIVSGIFGHVILRAVLHGAHLL